MNSVTMTMKTPQKEIGQALVKPASSLSQVCYTTKLSYMCLGRIGKVKVKVITNSTGKKPTHDSQHPWKTDCDLDLRNLCGYLVH